jgi:hypothetical protein
MAAQIPDDVLDIFAITGTYDEIVDKIAKRYTGVVDTVALTGVPKDFDPVPLREVIDAVHRIPTKFEGYNTDWGLAKQAPQGAAPYGTSPGL